MEDPVNNFIKWFIVALIATIALILLWVFSITGDLGVLFVALFLAVIAYGFSRMSARPSANRRHREKMI